MKKIFSSPNLIEMTSLKDILEGAGMTCFIRNEMSTGLAPEIPANECTPELWIQDDDRLAEAQQIKQDWQTPTNAVGSEWVCSFCGEKSEPQFTTCWKCGAAKP